MDSRDLEKEIQDLEERENSKENPLDKEELEHLNNLRELKEECEGYGWDYGIHFIKDSEFFDYAQELAYDCYGVEPDKNPLFYHIDWDSWAKSVEMDYDSIDFEGESYLFREA